MAYDDLTGVQAQKLKIAKQLGLSFSEYNRLSHQDLDALQQLAYEEWSRAKFSLIGDT